MVFFKNVLLLVAIFIALPPARAELIGGHEKQRLMLLLSEMLEEYYIQYPLKLHLPTLPITINPTEEFEGKLYLILITLNEEGLVGARDIVVNDSIDGRFVSRRDKEFYKKSTISDALSFGRIADIKVSSLVYSQTDDQFGVTVNFSWRLYDPVAWLWANRLNSIEEISYLRYAATHAQQGVANFLFLDTRWQLLEAPDIYQ